MRSFRHIKESNSILSVELNHITPIPVMATALLLLFSCNFLFAGNPELLFEAGSKAYLDGEWNSALGHWQQIEESGFSSGALYYNIGNAFYKTGELGKAILYWEKAARLMGEDGDLTANLEIARAKLIDDLDEPVRLPVWDWFDRLRARFSSGALAYSGIMFCFMVFAAIALRRWIFRNIGIRKGLMTLTWVLVILTVFDLSLLTLKARDDLRQREGILIAGEAEILSAPAMGTGKLLFSLHEGTKVRIHRELEGWFEISAGKDRQGWIRKGALGVI